MNRQQTIETMAHLVCEMANKPDSCKECPGRKGGCFTIPKMEKLVDNGFGLSFFIEEKLKEVSAEVEKLQKIVDDGAEVCDNCHYKYGKKIEAAKSEARKEFAERLKEKFPSNSHWVKPKEMVDNLLKEMEG